MPPVTIAGVLRLVATICFVLAIFSVPWPAIAMACLGLALWCASTFVP